MGEQAGFVLEWTKTFAPWQVYSREFLDALSATLKRIIVEVRNPAQLPAQQTRRRPRGHRGQEIYHCLVLAPSHYFVQKFQLHKKSLY